MAGSSPPVGIDLTALEQTCDDFRVKSVERSPRKCPNGHPFGAYKVLIGWAPCDCTPGAGGHRTYECRTCGVTIARPPHVGPLRPGVQWS